MPSAARVGRERRLRNVGWVLRKCQGKSGEQDVEVLAVLVRVKSKSSRACSGVLHGGDVVAADGHSGHRGARAG
jgi:hypothetical protein